MLWELRNLFHDQSVSMTNEEVMRAYFAKLTPRASMIVALSLLALAYPVVTILLPLLVRAMVPDVVQEVLRFL